MVYEVVVAYLISAPHLSAESEENEYNLRPNTFWAQSANGDSPNVKKACYMLYSHV
jgi:hypothetical protein